MKHRPRDRDRLRQQVLEDRGWIIHRIWSTDWFKKPKEQLRQLLTTIEDAKVEWAQRGVEDGDCDSGSDQPQVVDIDRQILPTQLTENATSIATPYVEASFRIDAIHEIYELQAAELATVVAEIVKLEGPIHQDELARRTASLWGLKRTGRRIMDAVERALAEATFHGVIVQSGLFFSTAGQDPVLIRDRSAVTSPNLLKPEYLPPQEVRAALSAIVRINFGINPEEAVTEVVRLLGFKRTGTQLRQMVSEEMELMVADGLLAIRNGKVYGLQSDGEHTESLSVG